MTALIIIAAVLCVLLILLYARVYVIIGYNSERDTEPNITVSYLFLRFGILPQKKKKINLRDYSYKNFKKAEEKRIAEKKKEALKKNEASKKTKKAASKTASSASNKKSGEKAQEQQKKSVVAALWEIKDLIFDTLKRFPAKLRLDISRLKINVGSKDAATTAITYGIVTEAVGAVLAVLDNFVNVKREYKKEVEILPDFTSGKITADVLIGVSITPAALLSLIFGFIGGFVIKFVKKNTKI